MSSNDQRFLLNQCHNSSEEDDFQIIDQLDGTSGGNSPSRSKNKNKNTAKKQENKTIKYVFSFYTNVLYLVV